MKNYELFLKNYEDLTPENISAITGGAFTLTLGNFNSLRQSAIQTQAAEEVIAEYNNFMKFAQSKFPTKVDHLHTSKMGSGMTKKLNAIMDSINRGHGAFSEKRSSIIMNEEYQKRLNDDKENERRQKEEQERQSKANAAELAYAIVYLSTHGKIYGADFDVNNAVNLAVEMKFEELKNAAIDNTRACEFNIECDCDECGSWNGVDHRCSCGNRRVYWTFEGGLENMYILSEVY